jgi:hypothetical protein
LVGVYWKLYGAFYRPVTDLPLLVLLE